MLLFKEAAVSFSDPAASLCVSDIVPVSPVDHCQHAGTCVGAYDRAQAADQDIRVGGGCEDALLHRLCHGRTVGVRDDHIFGQRSVNSSFITLS